MSQISARNNGLVEGELADGDMLHPTLTGHLKDDYELTDVEVGQPVYAVLSSFDFGVRLQIVNAETDEVVAEDSSRLLGFIPVEDTSYIIRVTSDTPDEQGAYVLAVGDELVDRLWIAEDGDWAVAENWLRGGLPEAGDEVLINVDGEVVVTSQGNVSIQSLTTQEQLRITDGLFEVNSAARIEAQLALSGGTLQLNDGGGFSSIRELTLSGGNLTGEAGFVAVQTATWTAGSYQGQGLTVVAGGTAEITGDGNRGMSSAKLTNQGTINVLTSIDSSGDSIIDNQSTGLFDIRSDLILDKDEGSNFLFTNRGVLRKSQGAGDAVLEVDLTNTGTIESSSGNLVFSESYTQTAGLTRLNGGNLSVTQPLILEGGILDGTGTLSTDLLNTAGALNAGLDDNIGVLNLDGDYTQSEDATLTIQLGGTNPGDGSDVDRTFDLLRIGGSAAFDGTLELDLVNDFIPAIGDRFIIATFESLTPGAAFEQILQSELLELSLQAITEFGDQDLSIVIASLEPPTLSLENSTAEIAEDTNTSQAIRLTDITVTDPDGGTHQLTLSGSDAEFFELVDGDAGAELFLKADVALDFETRSQYRVTVEVDDPALANDTPEDTQSFLLNITDVLEDVPLSQRKDFDGNGSADLVFRDPETGEAAIALTNSLADNPESALELTDIVALQPWIRDGNWQIQAVGDFDGDEKADIAWRNVKTGQNVLWRMDGTTPLGASALPAEVNRDREIRGAADVDGDGTSDLIWLDRSNGDLEVWYLDNAEVRETGALSNVGRNLEFRGLGDLNGDGSLDFVWFDETENRVSVGLVVTEAEIVNFQQVDAIPLSGYELGAMDDYNLDGRTDLMWHNSTTGAAELWAMNGTSVNRSSVDLSHLNSGMALIA